MNVTKIRRYVEAMQIASMMLVDITVCVNQGLKRIMLEMAVLVKTQFSYQFLDNYITCNIGLPCDARPGICGEEMCLNVGDGVRCVPGCRNGYNLEFMSLRCVDLKDCRRNPCGYGQSCRENRGFFRCSCRK